MNKHAMYAYHKYTTETKLKSTNANGVFVKNYDINISLITNCMSSTSMVYFADYEYNTISFIRRTIIAYAHTHGR